MDDIILSRIDSIIKNIDLVLSDTKGIRIEDLDDKSVLLRATCFSISQIGEHMNVLQSKLEDRYPNLPWRGARVMRNFIVHDYGNVDRDYVADTIKNDLPKLRENIVSIRKDFE